ncbi:hypothetical protein RHSIM_Rhsim10G0139600 [Rhododendron simsii]|uniref:Receptor-like serine/threonine-protein kinase n=1 Tax=Rhododendron simsii TaxID=118357 RepID=A0A834GAE4_RHOSS|nr:hypothetical protein RHSIM_Rhsim10G0139600 [Rhododendron simsii]
MTTETMKENGKTSGSNPPVTPTTVVALVPTMVPVNHAESLMGNALCVTSMDIRFLIAKASKALKISDDKIKKMVKKFKERDEKCKSFSRTRRFRDEKDIDSINDVRNEHFNKKIERASEAQQTSTNISLNSSLKPTGTNSSAWLSPSGLYAFGFYRQGSGYAVGVFAAGLPEKTMVWTANRDDPPIPSNATLSFSDGRLVLDITPAQNPYIDGVTEEISVASMLDSGNFVLYNSVGKIIWQSFDNPTDTILPGQRLVAGKNLISSVSEGDHSSGLFRLKMQDDGHLIAYPLESPDSAPYAYWASGTDGSGNNITLNLDDNGHLYLLNRTGANIIKNITEGESEKDGKIYRMTLDADGIFRVYSLTLDSKGNWSVMWRSTSDKCAPRGLCGLNSFCIMNDDKAGCRCLPGFDVVNPEDRSLGCGRNFSAVNCDNTNGSSADFTMIELESMQWEDQPYTELGRGAFGTVYKGILPYNQKVVAVKKLEKALAEGEREFHREIRVIGRTHHRNLVQLIGYCFDGPNRLLVYEYMCNGSLADFLFTHERPQPNWDEKVKIAHDIARGIHYLHDECETQIIHCVIKPQNILMDEHCCAKISDFGLAKLSKALDQTKTYTGIRGTRGYVAPEWHRKLPITVKADVYSFGIVLLEIICGRKCLDWSRRENEAVLEDWVYDCYEAKELGKLVGEEEEVDMRRLERMVKVGLWCIQDESSLRPLMKKVLLMIEGIVYIPTPPSPTSFLSVI